MIVTRISAGTNTGAETIAKRDALIGGSSGTCRTSCPRRRLNRIGSEIIHLQVGGGKGGIGITIEEVGSGRVILVLRDGGGGATTGARICALTEVIEGGANLTAPSVTDEVHEEASNTYERNIHLTTRIHLPPLLIPEESDHLHPYRAQRKVEATLILMTTVNL